MVLIINRRRTAAPGRVVIVESGKPLEIGREFLLLNPPIEPNHFRVILTDDLCCPGQPVVQIGRIGMPVKVVFIRGSAVRGTVEGCKLRVIHIGIESPAAIHEEVMFGTMRGCAEMQPGGAHGFLQVTDHVPLRPHFRGAPIAEVRIVHGESIMVFSHGDHVPGAGFPE